MTRADVFSAEAMFQSLREQVGQELFELWFANRVTFRFDTDLTIGVCNRFYLEWLEARYRQHFVTALESVIGESRPLRFVIDPTLFRVSRLEQETVRTTAVDDSAPPPPEQSSGSEAAASATPTTAVHRSTPSLHRQAVAVSTATGSDSPSPTNVRRPPSRYALARFVVDSSNRLPFAAALGFAEHPETEFSPLVLTAGIGLGKTHLLRGIEEELQRKHPKLKVMSFSGEEFTNYFVDSMRTGKADEARKKLRRLDVLLIDDLQFFANRWGTQGEFLHTLDALDRRSAKVAVTIDCHPRRLAKVSDELRSRLCAGLVARIEPPTRDLRLQVVRDQAAARRLLLAPEAIDYLADKLHGSIREIEGALNLITLHRDLGPSVMDLPRVRRVLGDYLRQTAPRLTVESVRDRACEFFGIAPKVLFEKSRARAVTLPRMLIQFVARKMTEAPYSEIGAKIGGMNHSSVIAAEKRFRKELESDTEFPLGEQHWRLRDAVEAVEREIRSQ